MRSDIAIWGAGEFGRFIFEQIRTCPGLQVKYFVDNDEGKKSLEGVPVLAPSVFNENRGGGENVWIAVADYYQIGAIFEQIHQLGIDHAGFFLPDVWHNRLTVSSGGKIKSEYLKEYDISHRAVLTKLEYHVADHCNLNCRGCTHFSPLFKENFGKLDLFERDIKKLSELFANILRIRLMGGEPFLNPQLDRFISIVGEYFPDTCLEVVSNGLLIQGVDQKILESMRHYNVLLQISLYPPTSKIQNKLSDFLEFYGIRYNFGSGLKQENESGVIDEFHKCFTLNKTHSPERAGGSCMGRECHYLRDGLISKCAIPLLVGQFDEMFNVHTEIEAEDYVDLYEESYTPWEIVEKLSNPTPFCAYCIDGPSERFQWECGNARKFKIEDYIVEDE